MDTRPTAADGHAERIAALSMIEPRADRPRAISLGADKAYDAEDFVNELRSMSVRPARGPERQRPAIGHRRTHDPPRRLRHEAASERPKSKDQVGWAFTFAAAAFNLVRLPKLTGAPG